jgi:uncharacterized protein (UPF0332 family)
MTEVALLYLAKAEEALEGAQSEFINRRYNNVANRAYYACFSAAVQALEDAGLQSQSGPAAWKHDALQAAFVGELINRRKLYSSDLRSVLLRNQELRETADYQRHAVTQTQAARAVDRAEAFVRAVQQRRARR